MTALLEIRHATKEFNAGGGLFSRKKNVALSDFSLIIEDDKPTIIAIAGESGSGKTTLARLLLGLSSPSQGQVLYKDRDLTEFSKEEWKTFRREVQTIFQDPFGVYNPFYKVDHMLTTPVAKFGMASSKAETQKLIEDALHMVGLRPEETLGRFPHQLSGGQRQRIMIARALLLKPRIIIADEPVSMVDASLRATILDSLLKLNQEMGISLMYITHDLTTAYQLSDDIYVFYQGTVTEMGDVGLVIKQPQHPYTQLLVGSIPLPDPELQWGQDHDIQTEAEGSDPALNGGCKFAHRCPKVIAKCHNSPPPLFQTDSKRSVACYLYQDADEL